MIRSSGFAELESIYTDAFKALRMPAAGERTLLKTEGVLGEQVTHP
jgi:hypothetical protein